MPTVSSCPADQELVTMEYKGCGSYSYCKAKVKPVPEPEPIICPAVVSPTSCPPGMVLNPGSGKCPMSYCEPSEEGPPVSPQELKGDLRQIRDQQREVKQLAKTAAKIPVLLAEVQAFQRTLDGFAQTLSAANVTRVQLEEYRQARTWEDLNALRQKVEPLRLIVQELPGEIRKRQIALKTLEIFFNGKGTLNALSIAGVNTEALKQSAVGYRGALEELNRVYQQAITTGSEETIQQAEELRADLHQPDSSGTDRAIREWTSQLRTFVSRYARPLGLVRDEEIRAALKELLSGMVEAVNSNDLDSFREASRDFTPAVQRLFTRARQVRTNQRATFLKQIESVR